MSSIDEALRVARHAGFLEVSFSDPELHLRERARHPVTRLQRQWEEQCATEGRLPVSVGRIRDRYFVALPSVPETARDQTQEVFVRCLGMDPILEGDAWFSLLVPRETALDAVRALIAIDMEHRARSRPTLRA